LTVPLQDLPTVPASSIDARRSAALRVRGLYAVTPDLPDRIDWLARCVAAVAGGARVLQYRDKRSALAERVLRARALRRICDAHDALLIINDDAALAAACDADGVHLGLTDATIATVRTRWPGLLIGATCHAQLPLAERAVADGADYIAFGAVFPSSVKPEAVAAPLSLFAEAARAWPAVPSVAIGGITRANAASVRAAGASACAVITDLFTGDHAPTPEAIASRAAEFRRLLEEAS
jgi:thiamine-phosphate pyrophosphorylase